MNLIKGLLATQGSYDYEPLRRDRLERFEDLTTAMERPIPHHLRNEIVRHLQRLELVLEMIRAVEAQRDSVVEAAPKSGSSSPLVRREKASIRTSSYMLAMEPRGKITSSRSGLWL